MRNFIKRKKETRDRKKLRVKPLEEADGYAEDWAHWWMRTPVGAPDRLDAIYDQHFPNRASITCAAPTAEQLKEAARGSKDSSAGLDGWTGAVFARLPESAFVPLSEIWDECLAQGQIPTVWKHVQTVMIPKEDGSKNPYQLLPLPGALA